MNLPPLGQPQPSPPVRPSVPPRPIQYEVDLEFPVEYRVVHRLEFDPAIVAVLNRFIATLENPMTAQEFKDYLDAKVNELSAQAATEHDQVLAAIAAAGNQVSDNVPDSAKSVVDAAFNTLTGAVQGIFDAPSPAPSPTGTPTPTPSDGGTPPAPPV